nr:hypothetical protein [uncultured Nitrososphaera sp.]
MVVNDEAIESELQRLRARLGINFAVDVKVQRGNIWWFNLKDADSGRLLSNTAMSKQQFHRMLVVFNKVLAEHGRRGGKVTPVTKEEGKAR